MTGESEISRESIDKLYDKLNREATGSGYHLNPDIEFTRELLRGIMVNEARYGYWNCPCRLASGNKAEDNDIICPCYYRDADLSEYGCCYCALYVSGAALKSGKEFSTIPERRPPPAERKKAAARSGPELSSLSQPVWRCRVCGYMCARGEPPEVCPICKAKKERFERFI